VVVLGPWVGIGLCWVVLGGGAGSLRWDWVVLGGAGWWCWVVCVSVCESECVSVCVYVSVCVRVSVSMCVGWWCWVVVLGGGAGWWCWAVCVSDVGVYVSVRVFLLTRTH
jgi:hypothetical protein